LVRYEGGRLVPVQLPPPGAHLRLPAEGPLGTLLNELLLLRGA